MRNEQHAAAGADWFAQSDPMIRLMLGFGAFVLAIVMLAGFYVVIQQGVSRAHTHWENATRMVSACDAGQLGNSRDRCGLSSTSASASVNMGNLRASR